MDKQPSRKVYEYVRMNDLFRSAQKTSVPENVKTKMREERDRAILDMSSIRRQEDWSLLADKTVGAEGE